MQIFYYCAYLAYLLSLRLTESYKPVLIMHGILEAGISMETVKKTIQRKHPGTKITIIDMFNDADSLFSMELQTKVISEKYKEDFKNPSGVHVIGYSQGGILLRGIIQTIDDHNIHTLSCLSSPLMGEYGIPFIAQRYIPKVTLKIATDYFYSLVGQDISVGNYWNDPTEHDRFLKDAIYLSELNYPKNINYKDNFLKLRNISLIGGPEDGVILPWISSQFGYYDADLNMHSMEELDVYLEDTFGLKTLNEQERIKRFTFKNHSHQRWPYNVSIIEDCIVPFLD